MAETVKNLVEMGAGEEGIISNIDSGMGLCRRLNAMGVVIGAHVRKISDSFLHGPVTIQVGNTRTALGWGMAAKVYVKIKE